MVEFAALPVGWSLISGSGALLVLAGNAHDPLVAQLRPILSADRGKHRGPLDDVLDVLLQAGIRAMSHFVAVDEVDPVRLIVRGAPVVEVTVSGKVRSIGSGGARSWFDIEIPDQVDRVRLSLPTADQNREPEHEHEHEHDPDPDRQVPPSYDDLFASTGRAMAFHVEEKPMSATPNADGSAPPPAPSAASTTVGRSAGGAGRSAVPAYISDDLNRLDEVAKPDVTAGALAADVQAPMPGPILLAVLCPAGHPSPAHAATCRVCKREIPSQQPYTTLRPALGVIRLSTGDVVKLDRGVLLGRAPEIKGGPTGADRPNVLRLPSPDHDISRNHVEILLEGWNVVVRDLGSANGTVVALPGQASIRLRPNDQRVIEPGTVVDLADEVSFTYEVQA